MKIHVGTDTREHVHSLTTADAATADMTQLDRQQCEAAGGRFRINHRGPRTVYWNESNHAGLRVRARCEHVFHVVKRLWGFAKVRFRGLEQ